jgi:hypothetical protein
LRKISSLASPIPCCKIYLDTIALGQNPLKPFYDRLVGRGKAKKVALVAAARKILTWAWTIFSRQIKGILLFMQTDP